MARLNPEESFEILKSRVAESISSYFPHEGDKHVIELKDVVTEDNKNWGDFRDQKKHKMNGRTWGVPVKGTFVVKDKNTGKVLSEDTVKLATIPKITSRYSYIVDGTEYQVENLWRLKPGVYSRVKANGELESHFNVKGRGFHVNFDPKSRSFKVRHGGAQPPLYPVMKALGVSDEKLEKTWGKEIFSANKLKQADVEKKAIAFASRLDKYAEIKDFSDAAAVIKDKFKGMEMDPSATSRTLGKGFNSISPDAVVATSGKLLGIARGKDKPDDRDSLMFKELLSIEDMVGERIKDQYTTVKRRIDNNLDRKRSVKSIISPDIFGRPVVSFFGKTSLANPPDQINPLEMVIGQQKTTILGEEGGIKSAHRITEEAKLVNASHMGVMDPLQTPEGEKTGVTLHLSLGAHKTGKGVTIKLFDVKKNKMVRVSPEDAFDSVVALPDEVKWKDNKPIFQGSEVSASLEGNEIGKAKVGDVKYILKHPMQLFTIGSNLVPFLQNNSANRATMAGRQMEQAIPLKHREQPLVQAMYGNKSYDKIMGNIAAIESPIEGTVTKVSKDFIRIKGADGKTQEVDIYDNYPLNDKKSFLTSEPLVKEGDQVKPRDVLADTNFSKGGVYAPGINLTTAYIPYKGLNYEDGIVISESAAKKLTSEHMYKKGLGTKDGFGSGKKKYKAYFPDRINKEQDEKLDDDGVIKPGQIVMPGDTLVTGLAEQQLTTEQQKLRMMHKSLVKPYKDKAITWDEDKPGKVVEVHRRRNGVAVHIKTEEPAEIGDKIVARHANKGIITAIIPDKEMPHTKDGKPVDTLMNPLGVPGRINLGQVLETAAGKIAKKRGQPYTVTNFDGEDHLTKLRKELEEEGLTDTETLKDPVSGKEIKDVFVGEQYTLKLHHQVGKKMSARSRDAYDRNLIPRGGGSHGAQSLGALGTYAMLAHGATENLREFQTMKCFSWSTPVITIDGPIPIGKIVNQKLDVEVLSYNAEYDALEYRKILNHWKRDVADTPIVEITVTSSVDGGPYKRRRIKCSHEHEIYENETRKVFAKDAKIALVPGPELLQHEKDVLVGSLLADGYMSLNKSPFPAFQERHCLEQKPYLEFKADVLHRFSRRNVREYNAGCEGFNIGQTMCEWGTLAHPAFSELYPKFYKDKKRVLPKDIHDILNPLALAILYQDDGSYTVNHEHQTNRLYIHTGKYNEEDVSVLGDVIRQRYGIVFRKEKNINDRCQLVTTQKGEINKFLELVRPYVHPSMSYKVGYYSCGEALVDIMPCPTNGIFPVEIESVQPSSLNLWEGPFLYNLEVDGNHNYFAGGILVGNSDKSQGGDSDELWAALQAGERLPPPRPTFAYKKFIGYMNAMGINVEKDGNSLNLMPLTDKQVIGMSHGEIKDGGRMVKTKNMEPEKGGLFDPDATGGMGGTKWSHIKLREPMPNPLFQKAIMSVTGIRGPEFDAILEGNKGVTPSGEIVGLDNNNAVYGPAAFNKLLGKVDVKKELSAEEKRIGGLTGQSLNESNRRIKYLRALNKLDMKPTDAYMMKYVPVLPPAMRPLSIMDDGSLNFDDVNQIYKHVSLTNQKLGQVHRLAPDEEKNPLRAELYDNLKALTGIGGTINRQYPGILDTIAGTSPKMGFVQDKLIKRKQDMSMRSTIIPDPKLSLDEVGIPRKAAMEMFKPFVVRELRKSAGLTPLGAQKAIKDDSDLAHRALENVVKERPVLLKRDPVLHKYGIQAFQPKLTTGRAIQIHPLVTGGYNADFDGDAMAAFVPVSNEAVKEANNMKPSKLLFSPSTYDVMYAPGKEMQVGLYLMTEKGKRTNKKFPDKNALEKAYSKGEVGLTDIVRVGNVTTTLGRTRIDSVLPKNMQGGEILTNLNKELDKGAQKNLFSEMAKSDPKAYPQVVNAMKDLGNESAYESGFSFGLKDFAVHKDVRDAVFAEADNKVKGLNLKKPDDVEKFVGAYNTAMVKMKNELKRRRDIDKYKTRLTRLDKASGVKGDGLLQITGSPTLFVDSKGDVVLSPVKRSYSEGLRVADYWANVAGGRKGIVQKVQSVRDPGYLSKLMVNSTMNQVVDKDDCGTDRGIRLSVLEPDIIGRYTAVDTKVGRTTIPANTLVDTEVLDKMKNARVSKVVVRSPMRCNHHNGLCSKCYGLNENGVLHDKGTNIGVLAAQSLGEPGTQMAMKSFHCNHAKSLVHVCPGRGSLPIAISMEDLFHLVDGPIGEDENGEFKHLSAEDGWLILGESGWTLLTTVVRHKPTRPMIIVSDGTAVTVCQDNHPIAYRPNLVRCERCGYHRLKKPGKNASIKNGKWFCPKCNKYQYPPENLVGEDIMFMEAGDLEPKRVYLERRLPDFSLNTTDLDIDPYIAGMYVAEGGISYRWTNPNNRVKKPYSFTISQKEGEIRSKLESRIPKEWKAKSKKKFVEVHSLKIATLMEKTFNRYSRNVSLPPDFLRYSPDWLSTFLCGLIDGDGSKKSDTDGADRIAIDTTSFELAQQVVMICSKLGIVSNLHTTSNRDSTKHQGFRVVLRVTKLARDLLKESLKVSRIEKLSPDQDVTISGSTIMTSKKNVLYTDEYVYDVTTASQTFVAGGLVNHNSGGVYEGKSTTSIAGAGLERAKTMLTMPKVVKGSAILSSSTGRITNIRRDPAGGYNVTIGGQKHYIPHDRKLMTNLRAGMTVRKGDPISSGPVNPHEMLPLTGINRVQGQLASELHDIYGKQGIRRRNSEVVVRALSNITKIEDPGDNPDLVKGDFAPTTVVQHWNSKEKGKRPVTHIPVMRGVKQVPLDMQEDWLARLNHEKLKETIIEGAQRGWQSDLHGIHPVPPLIYSAEFGKKKPY